MLKPARVFRRISMLTHDRGNGRIAIFLNIFAILSVFSVWIETAWSQTTSGNSPDQIRTGIQNIPSFWLTIGLAAVMLILCGLCVYLYRLRKTGKKWEQAYGELEKYNRELGERVSRLQNEIRFYDKQIETLFSASMTGVFRLIPDKGRIVSANIAAAKLLGCDSVDALIKNFEFQKSFDDPAQYEEICETLKKTGKITGFEITIRNYRKDRKIFILNAVVCLDQSYARTAMIDITEQRRLEDEVKAIENLIEPFSENRFDRESFEGMRVLLADDDMINCHMAAEILENAGFIVDIARNGKEAVAALNLSYYEVVLLDIEMPELNGYLAAQMIRTDERFSHLPIFALTAHSENTTLEKCIQYGINDYIAKPLNIQMFTKKLSAYVKPWKKKTIRHKEPLGFRFQSKEETLIGKSIPLEIIDIDKALQILDGNHGLYRRLLAAFADTHKSFILDLKEALSKNDDEEARLLTHTLKGTAANICAKRLETSAFELEKAIERKDPEKTGKMIDLVGEALHETLEYARQYCGSTSFESVCLEDFSDDGVPPETSAILDADKSKLVPLLSEFDKFLQEYDPEGVGKRMELVRKHFIQTALYKEIMRLEVSLRRFDYDEARQILLDIAEYLGVYLVRS